jgi:hypothetical protein
MQQKFHQETLSRCSSGLAIHHKTIEEFGFVCIFGYAVAIIFNVDKLKTGFSKQSSVCHCDPFHFLHTAHSSYFFTIKLN